MNTSHKLYLLLEQQKYNEIETIINNIDIYKTNNSILTCIISYYIKTNNKMLDTIKKDISMFDLHKRDYMMLCKYYYNIDNKNNNNNSSYHNSYDNNNNSKNNNNNNNTNNDCNNNYNIVNKNNSNNRYNNNKKMHNARNVKKL